MFNGGVFEEVGVTCSRGMVSRFTGPEGMNRVRGTSNVNRINGSGYNSVVGVCVGISGSVVASMGFGAFNYNTTVTADDVTARLVGNGSVGSTLGLAGGTIVRTLSKLPPIGIRYSILTRRTVGTTISSCCGEENISPRPVINGIPRYSDYNYRN